MNTELPYTYKNPHCSLWQVSPASSGGLFHMFLTFWYCFQYSFTVYLLNPFNPCLTATLSAALSQSVQLSELPVRLSVLSVNVLFWGTRKSHSCLLAPALHHRCFNILKDGGKKTLCMRFWVLILQDSDSELLMHVSLQMCTWRILFCFVGQTVLWCYAREIFTYMVSFHDAFGFLSYLWTMFECWCERRLFKCPN